MKTFRQTTSAIALACALGTTLYAATVNAAPPDSAVEAPHHGSSADQMARMEKMHAAKEKEIHDLLKITPAQEEAWKTFTTSMKSQRPAPDDKAMPPPPKKGEAGPTAPEMLDMRLAMVQREEAMLIQHATAVKAFYAQLTPDQQKLFDYISRREMRRMHGFGHGGADRNGGKPPMHRGDASMPPK